MKEVGGRKASTWVQQDDIEEEEDERMEDRLDRVEDRTARSEDRSARTNDRLIYSEDAPGRLENTGNKFNATNKSSDHQGTEAARPLKPVIRLQRSEDVPREVAQENR